METITAYLGKALHAISAPLNAVKDGYLAAVGWIEAHPHRTFWAAVAALVVAVWL